jgi:hypothetical protein
VKIDVTDVSFWSSSNGPTTNRSRLRPPPLYLLRCLHSPIPQVTTPGKHCPGARACVLAHHIASTSALRHPRWDAHGARRLPQVVPPRRAPLLHAALPPHAQQHAAPPCLDLLASGRLIRAEALLSMLERRCYCYCSSPAWRQVGHLEVLLRGRHRVGKGHRRGARRPLVRDALNDHLVAAATTVLFVNRQERRCRCRRRRCCCRLSCCPRCRRRLSCCCRRLRREVGHLEVPLRRRQRVGKGHRRGARRPRPHVCHALNHHLVVAATVTAVWLTREDRRPCCCCC